MTKIKIYQQKKFGEFQKPTMPWSNHLVTKEEIDKYYQCTVDVDVKELPCINNENVREDLEKIFTFFNIEKLHQNKYPINYSLSVGDIVELNEEKYQVMGAGFEKIKLKI